MRTGPFRGIHGRETRAMRVALGIVVLTCAVSVSGVTSSAVVGMPPRDSFPPTTTAHGVPSSWTSATVTVSFSVEYTGGAAETYFATGTAAPQPYRKPIDISAEGTTTIRYWSADKQDPAFREETKTVNARIDRSAPQLATSNSVATDGTVTVSATASDTLSGVAWIRYSLDGKSAVASSAVTVSAPGTHTVLFEAQDNAGNKASKPGTVTIDAPTSVTFSGSASPILYGAIATLSGVVTDTAGIPVGGTRVALEYARGGVWVKVAGATSAVTTSGAFVFRVKPSQNTVYRAVFLRSGALAPSTSASVRVNVKASLTRPVLLSRPIAGRALSVAGSMLPRHAGPITVEVLRPSGRTWVVHRRLSVRSTSTGSWRAAVTLKRGTYRVRAIHQDAGHAKNVSAYLSVAVR